MDELFDQIRAATSPDATADARAAGASACRALLAAIETDAGQPLAPAAPLPSAQIGALVAALRGMPPEQILDLAIARLRAALPADAPAPAVQPLKFHIIELPHGARR